MLTALKQTRGDLKSTQGTRSQRRRTNRTEGLSEPQVDRASERLLGIQNKILYKNVF